jgi:hypothetical protein
MNALAAAANVILHTCFVSVFLDLSAARFTSTAYE